MIRIVTTSRLEQLQHAARTADEHARQSASAANEAFGRHVRELYAVTDRAERAETTTAETSKILAGALDELAAAQKDLLLKDSEIDRLRGELESAPTVGQSLTVLLHYGEPHTIYRTQAEAHADTVTHGARPDEWKPCGGERPAAESTWRCEAFIYDAESNGYRRAFLPSPVPVGGAA
ncbi:hypothetical protein [Streptomyces sp. NBC_00859]|uniref:hypothetical protein n=1 Tax=Streptomyces sp. NBC_00859 TaxID=2903682 RepID=UPI00386C1F19|nr:hypothetical protein OG584_15025 [Streptomyces sp. NBC_00859]